MARNVGFGPLVIFLLAAMVFAGAPCVHAQVTAGDDGPIRLGRFEAEGKVRYGYLSTGGVHELSGGFFDKISQPTGRVFPLDQVRLLAPVVPGKVIGIALNYASHGGSPSPEPKFFAKLPSAVIGPEAEIVPPPASTSLHYEGELVVVIGARARNVSVEDAPDYILGVTAGNDVTERGFPFSPFDILRAKGSDTLSPLGPWITLGLNADRLRWWTRVNGRRVQASSTAKMIHSTAQIVSSVSAYITLEPGDVIYTGTAGTTDALEPGDVVEVEIEGVGTLKNTVAAPR